MPTVSRLRDTGNQLLDRLPADEFVLLEPRLERVTLSIKQILHQFESDVSHVHFPTTALISLLTILEEDDPVEAATVGRDGFVGLAASLGVGFSPHRVLCQMPGESLRLPVGAFLETLGRAPTLARLVSRYVAFSLRSISQGIACNALHPIEARAARWLLMIHDQAGTNQFPLTQEFWAFILGVRRQSVTVVAGALQNAGLIEYHRGAISIRDRDRLTEVACECYASTRSYYERIVSSA